MSSIQRKILCLAAVLALPFAARAATITLDVTTGAGSRFIGSISPDGGSEVTEAGLINVLISLGSGTTVQDGQTYTRSGNYDPSLLPAAIVAGNTGNIGSGLDNPPPGSLFSTVTLSGYDYLLGKYDHADAGAYVWYIGGLSGEFEIPALFNGHALSHYVAYAATAPEGPSVPDNGSIVGLIGMSFLAIGVGRRFMRG
jgi:hypothetical protein